MKNNPFKYLIMAIMFMVTITTFAVPAKRVWKTVTLTDGSQIKAMTVGDEHGHWMIDSEGKALAVNSEGKASYMSDTELSSIKSHRTERMNHINAIRISHMENMRTKAAEAAEKQVSSAIGAPRKTFGEPTAISGNKKGIVILVNFSDKSLKEENTQAVFNNRFNQEGYSAPGYIGSVHDYFYDQSYGKFNLFFDVVGPVTVSNKHDYYGENDSYGNDKKAATMVIEALKLADAKGVDFSKYDWDNDGYVDQVFVIYAGTGENASDEKNDIWPHEYTLASAKQDDDGTGEQTLDGVKINTYACSCELANNTTIDGIGTACHEFSHCLGYADLYDTDYSGGQGMLNWDLLDSGSYNGPNDNGEVPAAYTSFERWWAGWLTPTVLESPQYINDMPALNDEAVAYKIINDNHTNEYYLLENRQAKRWDKYTAGNGNGTGHGMMILHVDYDKDVWQKNAPNDTPNRQRMTYFPADNSYGTKNTLNGQYYWSMKFDEAAGDPFPGTKNNTSFTDFSSPAATLYNTNTDNTKYMGKPITEIAESDGKISFSFMGGIAAPESQEPTKITTNSFIAAWSPVEGADSYDLEVKELVKGAGSTTPVLTEDFSKCKRTLFDGNRDISSNLDYYTSTAGWSGYKVFDSNNSIKVGTSTAQGYIITPELISPESECVTAKLSLKAFSTDKTTVSINILNSSNAKIATKSQCLSTTYTDYVLNFEDIAEPYKIELSAVNADNNIEARFYVTDVALYDGNFSADDLAASSSAKSPVKAESKILNNITGTSYELTDLTKGGTYKYRVRANVGTRVTSWSNYTTVILTATGISTATISPSYTTDTSDTYYNIQGQRIDINTLTNGIYINNGKKYIKR